eukprot:8084851-Lingulodinium_polyedra.AAC.1
MPVERAGMPDRTCGLLLARRPATCHPAPNGLVEALDEHMPVEMVALCLVELAFVKPEHAQ